MAGAYAMRVSRTAGYSPERIESVTSAPASASSSEMSMPDGPEPTTTTPGGVAADASPPDEPPMPTLAGLR